MTLSREQELWACALAVEREHGDAAFLFAAMQADALGAEGKFEASRVWLAVLKRLEALERPETAHRAS